MGDGRAVDGNERAGQFRKAEMNGASQNPLSRPRFARDQDRSIDIGAQFFRRLDHRPDLRTAANEIEPVMFDLRLLNATDLVF